MASSKMLEMISSLHQEARVRGLFFQSSDLSSSDGRTIGIGGKELLWFGSCSYLGLDREPSLIEAAVDATRRFGTQFASSRGYVSVGLHAELEAQLGRMFDAHALLGQTTTLAHQAAFDVLATERDAVVLDHQVHISVQNAATLAQAQGAHVETVHHEHLERALDRLQALSTKHDRVWFATDGVTSMYGDVAPIDLLHQMLDVAPNVHLYVDDAHGTGWAGKHGRGLFLEQHGWSDRLVVATSLAKVPAAGGAAILTQDAALKEQIRTCGGTMVFSGPLQPPLLGAALAATDFFLSDALPPRQKALFDRIRRLKRGLLERGIPVLANNDAPVVFVPTGLPSVSFDLAERLVQAGFYVNIAMFPAVPMRRSGLRITLTPHLHPADIDGLIAALERLYAPALARAGVELSALLQDFSRVVVGAERARTSPTLRIAPAKEVPLATWDSIHQLPPGLWDERLGSVGCISADSLAMQEAVFQGPEPEHDWGFWYVAAGGIPSAPHALTVFTEQLIKDDMLASGVVSREVEAQRENDPYRLTSRVLMTGGGLSEGNHLYLDRSGDWQDALRTLLRAAMQRYEDRALDGIVLRDLPDDPQVEQILLGEGLVKMRMPERYLVNTKGESFLKGHSTRTRKHMRESLSAAAALERRVLTTHEVRAHSDHLHALHAAVVQRSRALNMFLLPKRLWEALSQSESWEIVGLFHRKDPTDDAAPALVGWYGAHQHQESYMPLMCGLDYDYVYSHRVYRSLLLTILQRGQSLGATTVHLGMTAGQEKQRVGATSEPASAWMMKRDTYSSAVLQNLETRLRLANHG